MYIATHVITRLLLGFNIAIAMHQLFVDRHSCINCKFKSYYYMKNLLLAWPVSSQIITILVAMCVCNLLIFSLVRFGYVKLL